MDQPQVQPKTETRRSAASVAGLVLGSTLAIFATLGATVAAGAAPRDPSRVAAVFPPWWTSVRSASAAASAGQIAGAGGAPFILILRGEPGELSQRLHAAGAWLLLDPDAAGQCNSPDNTKTPTEPR